MRDEVIDEKTLTIQRCVARAREQHALSGNFATDHDRQDIAVLNIQRACEAAIDIAFRIIRKRALGAPMANRDAFDLLVAERLIPDELGKSMKRMVGFRNVAVHQYQELNLLILERVIASGLDDLLAFSTVVLRL